MDMTIGDMLEMQEKLYKAYGEPFGWMDYTPKNAAMHWLYNERFDTTTSMGRAMMQIAAVFAQLERVTIAERVQDNMLMLSYTGRWLGGKTPFGFSSERIFQNKELGIPLPSVRTYALMRR